MEGTIEIVGYLANVELHAIDNLHKRKIHWYREEDLHLIFGDHPDKFTTKVKITIEPIQSD